MAAAAAITGRVNITAKSINNDSVASQFNSVLSLMFDYYKGVVKIVDADQGEFYFGLTLITTLTYTVNGTVTTVVMS